MSVRNMSILRKISNYWWCQLCGWGIMGLSILFYAYTFRQEITSDYLIKIAIYIVAGISSTHLLRLFIKKKNWLLLPVEKTLLRLAIAVILTSLLFSLLVMGLNEVAGVAENRRGLEFSARLFANILNIGIYIIPWVLLYYFYHYLERAGGNNSIR